MSSASRGLGFGPREAGDLLTLIEKTTPMNTDDWELISREHETVLHWPGRTAESLRRKFHSMHRRRKGTRRGVPVTPIEVRARMIKRAINEKRDGVRPGGSRAGEDESDEGGGDDSGGAAVVDGDYE
eukprot:CAMPEP_0194337916 /NCGR_PEP_ID=MMETSP0171-20130528/77766_1 /TAXON_ID=218684 /ORGANISM="Corethron pennatum, Strain L29A3" /LENGTH=126 /DNA_ID=CAMNT_0039101859 /DNA_START=117 /DNA_END=494 /DNA_ORIENTATION=-